MKCMLLIYHDEQSWEGITEAERQQIYGKYQELRGEVGVARSMGLGIAVASQ